MTARLLVLAAVALGLGGCAHVSPYERETLAAPEMQEPPRPLVHRARLHAQAVREGSRGGDGVVGGGCGCN